MPRPGGTSARIGRVHLGPRRLTSAGPAARHGFTLVELLTVVFIIALLIGLLVPSIGAARRQAKRTVTAKNLKSIEMGLEMFRTEQGKRFRATNGYPPSYAHPPLGKGFTRTMANEGRFPYLRSTPRVYGAHWLPAMLMGTDGQGFIDPGTVPAGKLRDEPWTWYDPDPSTKPDGVTLHRAPLYVTSDDTNTIKTEDLRGKPGDLLSADWSYSGTEPGIESLPVIADAFDYPILYYAANAFGKDTNMVADIHRVDNQYDGSATTQDAGVPYYFHDDNAGFTGNDTDQGWDFNGKHAIAKSGHQLTAPEIIKGENNDTFARYIMNRTLFRDLKDRAEPPTEATGLRPANSDKYLLISPGADSIWGTTDDVSNMPAFKE